MRHSGEQAGCASSVASPHVFCASHLLEVGNGPESRCLGQRCICLHSTFSVLCQGAIHLSCTCNRVSLSSALQSLAITAVAIAGPAAPLLPAAPSCHSFSPISNGMFTGHAVCHRDGSDTPTGDPFQPEICTCLHKRAGAHRQGPVCVCVRMTVFEE